MSINSNNPVGYFIDPRTACPHGHHLHSLTHELVCSPVPPWHAGLSLTLASHIPNTGPWVVCFVLQWLGTKCLLGLHWRWVKKAPHRHSPATACFSNSWWHLLFAFSIIKKFSKISFKTFHYCQSPLTNLGQKEHNELKLALKFEANQGHAFFVHSGSI